MKQTREALKTLLEWSDIADQMDAALVAAVVQEALDGLPKRRRMEWFCRFVMYFFAILGVSISLFVLELAWEGGLAGYQQELLLVFGGPLLGAAALLALDAWLARW